MKNTFIDIVIVIANLKDFIAATLYKKGHDVKMTPFDPMLTKKALVWQKRLEGHVPSLRVTFTGSASLKIPGQKDLDFVIGCQDKDFKKQSSKLKELLGKPFKKSVSYLEWRKSDRGVNVDILLASIKNRMYMRIIDAHKILRSNPHLLKEYKHLKVNFNGKDYKSFELKRVFLFNKIFYKYGRGLDFMLKS